MTKLPFCDFGAVIDPPSADVTAHVVEALAAEGLAGSRAARRGVVWLLRAQEPDGSLVRPVGRELRVRHRRRGPRADRRGRACLPSRPSGGRWPGWSPPERRRRLGRGPALLRRSGAGRAGHVDRLADRLGAAGAAGRGTAWPGAREAGVRWLAATQREDGTWDEPQFTGTGFPGDFYINYHLYRLVFPLSALGRYLAGRA